MLDVLRSTSSPSVSSHSMLLQLDDAENDVFSTPPTTPNIAHSFLRSHPTDSTGTTPTSKAMGGDDTPDSTPKQLHSRRGSRPSSLLLGEDDGRKWTGDVQLEAGSPDARRGSMPVPVPVNGGGSKSYDDDDKRHPAITPTGLMHSISTSNPHQQSRSALISQQSQRQQEQRNISATSPEEAHSHMQENHGLDNTTKNIPSPAASTGTLTTSTNSSADTTTTPSGSSTITQRNYTPAAAALLHHSSHPGYSRQPVIPLKSPCFVHSFLDKGASLADWLKGKHHSMPGISSPVSPQTAKPSLSVGDASRLNDMQTKPSHGPFAQASQRIVPLLQPKLSPGSSVDSDLDDEEEEGSSLTRQLAETAVGVREMSKQLGRARIRSNIQNVLIITKARDNRLIKLTRELALYLMLKPRYGRRGLVVYVDNQLRYSKRFDAAGIQRDHPELFLPFPPRRRSSSNNSLAAMANGNGSGSGSESSTNSEGQLRYWTSEMCGKSPHLFDFVVTLGGDGTVLFTSWLFQRIVPPVLPFALGSLGFLTNFDFADHRAVVDSAIDNGIRVNLRMRFTCTVYRAMAPEPGRGRRAIKKGDTGEIWTRNLEKGGWEALEGGWGESMTVKDGKKSSKDKEIMCFTTRPVESFEILNDLVVDRGPSPYMSLLELFGDEHHMTTVQADGLTIATPTGSTAYSLSAGGSLVHPEIPAILITPICPHTLSFRPMLLPDSMELRICVPFNSRSTAWASFDGRGRVELRQGDHIKVTASKYPFPTVCADKQSTDWFHAISRTLKWNERERQKSFVVVEEDSVKQKSSKQGDKPENVPRAVAKPGIAEKPEDEEEDDEEDEVSEDAEEEEEDRFDIDDSSAPEASRAPSSTDLAAMAKAQEEARQKDEEAQAREAAYALTGADSTFKGLRDRSGTVRSGIETPDRFMAAHPHPPNVSPRHVAFTNGVNGNSDTGANSITLTPGEHGDRDHIHSPRMLSSARSRIPRDRDLEAESANMKTPTMGEWPSAKQHRSRSREPSSVGRAFAVLGQDESDSNTSDSDA
ncbi:hypothetical protein ACEPAG_8100 [Sanghuangporus baumii]